MKSNKKGVALNEIPSVAIILVLAAVVIAIGAYVLTSIDSTAGFAANSTASNATIAGQTALGTLATWLPIIALVIAAVILIALLVSAFHTREM